MTSGFLTEAAVWESPASPLHIREVMLTELRSDEVRVRVEATGVCHTDLSWAAGTLFPRFPVVLGHETAGIIEAIGTEVRTVTVGERVIIALSQACGHCRYCESGTPMLCLESGSDRGRIHADGVAIHQGFGVGGFSRHVVVRESTVIRVPPDIPPAVAGVVGCAVSTGLGAVFNVAEVSFGSSVLVIGAGAVGLSVLMGARLAGAAEVCVVDPSQERRTIAQELGATRVVESVAELTGDRFAFTFEVVGRRDTMEFSIAAAERGGTATLIGAPSPEVRVSFPALDFVPSQKRILGCQTGNVRPHADYPRYFALHREGRLPLDRLVTSTIGFDSLQSALKNAESLKGLRTVVTF